MKQRSEFENTHKSAIKQIEQEAIYFVQKKIPAKCGKERRRESAIRQVQCSCKEKKEASYYENCKNSILNKRDKHAKTKKNAAPGSNYTTLL